MVSNLSYDISIKFFNSSSFFNKLFVSCIKIYSLPFLDSRSFFLPTLFAFTMKRAIDTSSKSLHISRFTDEQNQQVAARTNTTRVTTLQL